MDSPKTMSRDDRSRDIRYASKNEAVIISTELIKLNHKSKSIFLVTYDEMAKNMHNVLSFVNAKV